MPRITPSIWFDFGQAEQAAELYCSIFPNSEITGILRNNEASHDEPGTVVAVDFTLDGQPFNGINGGPQFPQTEAVSFMIPCADQAEVDRYWELLTADGGEESQCGWCKDRFGVSWQVVPNRLHELLSDPDEGRATRATAAMLGMRKLDIAALEAAADGVAVS